MKKIMPILLISLLLMTSTVFGITHVKSYVTKRGTYVAPHYKTTSNRTKIDNWSTKGNTNPFTGKKGYKK